MIGAKFLLWFVAVFVLTIGLDRLSHRRGYGSRGTGFVALTMMVVGVGGLFLFK